MLPEETIIIFRIIKEWKNGKIQVYDGTGTCLFENITGNL